MDVLEGIKGFYQYLPFAIFNKLFEIPLPTRALEVDKEKREIQKLNLK